MFWRPYNLAAMLALLLSCGIVRAGQGPELDKPTVKGNVSIQLPKGWTVNTPDKGPLIAAQAPQADKDAIPALLTITQDAGNKIDGAAQQAILAKKMPGYKTLEPPTAIVVGGLTGVYFGGSFKSGTVELRSRQYMFMQNNQIYTITFTCLNSTWETHQPLVEASVGTFTVKK